MMNRNNFQYNKREKEKEYDKYSGLESKPNKKPSFLTILIVGLLAFLVCSWGYENWLKPYLTDKKEQAEQKIVNAPKEADEISVESPDTTQPTTTPSPTLPSRREKKASSGEDDSGLSTDEILDSITHANVVKQARQLGVSTEGSTSEILERIARKNMERMGY